MKSFFRKLLPFLSIFLLISCTNGATSKGSLSITLGNNSRAADTVEKDWKSLGLTAESFNYEILVKFPDETEVKETRKWGESLELSDLEEGSYTVKIEAKASMNDVWQDKSKVIPGLLKKILEAINPDLSKEEPITFYKGSQTKEIIAGEVTVFDIKLKNAFTKGDDDLDDDEPADEPSDCPFYVDPIKETKFHTVKTLGKIMQPIDAFEGLKDGQYYQIVPRSAKTEESQYVSVSINLVTPKEGQEPEVITLKKDCLFYGANYFCILLMDREEDDKPYLFLTDYSESIYKDDAAFLNNLVETCMKYMHGETGFFDFSYVSYNAIQISQYMPQAYESFWKNYESNKLHKIDSDLRIERPYFLNELEEEAIKKLGIARININSFFKGEEETIATIYAMAGNSVSLPELHDSLVFCYDKECKKQVEGSSITVKAGNNNLYFNAEARDPEGGNPDGGNGGSTDPNVDISGSYFDNESKTIKFEKMNCYDGDNRFRANVDISDLFDKYTIKTGDTVVFTISGKTDLGISNIYWQFAEENNGEYEVYMDAYNSYSFINNGIRNLDSFSLPMPQNRITIPEGAKYNTFQLFYDGNSGITISNFKLSYRIYSADKNVYECKKSYSDGKWYNEFIVALKDYPAFEGKTFEGSYYFAASTTNGSSILIKKLELWETAVGDGGTWKAKNNESLPAMKLNELFVGGSDECGGSNTATLSNCFLQFKSEAINPQTPVTLVGFDIKTLN